LALLLGVAVALLVVVVRMRTASQAVPSVPSVEAKAPTTTVPGDSCVVYPSVPSDICVPHGTPLPTPTQISTVYVAFLNATIARNNASDTSNMFERPGSTTQFEAYMAPEIAADNQYITVLHSIPWPTRDRYDISVLTYYVNGDITFLSGSTCSGTCSTWSSLLQPRTAIQQSITTAVNHVLTDLGLPSSALNGYVSTAPTTTTPPPPTTTTPPPPPPTTTTTNDNVRTLPTLPNGPVGSPVVPPISGG
jgi:hypothetical protein